MIKKSDKWIAGVISKRSRGGCVGTRQRRVKREINFAILKFSILALQDSAETVDAVILKFIIPPPRRYTILRRTYRRMG